MNREDWNGLIGYFAAVSFAYSLCVALLAVSCYAVGGQETFDSFVGGAIGMLIGVVFLSVFYAVRFIATARAYKKNRYWR